MSFLEGWGIKYASFLELVFNGIQNLLEGGENLRCGAYLIEPQKN